MLSVSNFNRYASMSLAGLMSTDRLEFVRQTKSLKKVYVILQIRAFYSETEIVAPLTLAPQKSSARRRFLHLKVSNNS
jgi:hypothetical protein